MNRFLLSFVLMNDSEDKYVNDILSACLESGIEEITSCIDSYYIKIRFKNGVTARLWNRNKFYGWLSQGSFADITNKTIYEYDNARPSRNVMWRLYKAIRKYWKDKFGSYEQN